MKIVINTQTNAIIGKIDGVIEELPDTIYLDPPVGFEIEVAAEWSFNNGKLLHDPLIAIGRNKVLQKSAIKKEAAELIAASDWKLQRAKERLELGLVDAEVVSNLLNDRESIRQASNAAENALDLLTDLESVLVFKWRLL